MSIIALAFWIVFWMTVGPIILWLMFFVIAAAAAGLASLFSKGSR